MTGTTRPHLGDIFTISTGDGRLGIGQVVGASGRLLYFAVYDAIIDEDSSEQAVAAVERPVLLLGLSMPARLKSGDWTIVGSAEIPATVRLPAYKESVGAEASFDVVDHSGTRRRPATDLEVDILPFRKVVAPMYFDLALKAHLGLAEWREEFDAILFGGGVATSDMFGDR